MTPSPTHAVVDPGAVVANVAALGAHAGVPVMPVVKADAYGHGLEAVVEALAASGTTSVAVARASEARRVKATAPGLDVLVFGATPEVDLDDLVAAGVVLTVCHDEARTAVTAAGRRVGQAPRVHVEIDTGMERTGFRWYDLAGAAAALDDPELSVEAVYTHFASSDEADLTSARRQVERFEAATERLGWSGVRHAANSAAVAVLPEARYDLVRPGLLCYGVWPSAAVPRVIDARPALRWVAELSAVKTVRAGSPVSYGSTWAPERDTRVATVPVGYGDGWLRSSSNRGRVLVGGRHRPIVGRVCMDQFMVDLGDDDAAVGDEVVLIGEQAGRWCTAEEAAEAAGTIGYEILTDVGVRVPRVTGELP